jgi:hypothetical protein
MTALGIGFPERRRRLIAHAIDAAAETRATGSERSALDRDGGVLDRQLELDLGLAHAHPSAGHARQAEETLRDRYRKRLQQVVCARLRDLTHDRDDVAIVDSVVD